MYFPIYDPLESFFCENKKAWDFHAYNRSKSHFAWNDSNAVISISVPLISGTDIEITALPLDCHEHLTTFLGVLKWGVRVSRLAQTLRANM